MGKWRHSCVVLYSAGFSLVGCMGAIDGSQDTSAVAQDESADEMDMGLTSTPMLEKALEVLRINAGSASAYRDPAGRTWQSDPFAAGNQVGQTVNRGAIGIPNTKKPGIYQTERYCMTELDFPATNGTYTVNLYFAETYMDQPGQRVFDIDVEGKVLRGLDVIKETGAKNRALLKTFKSVVVRDQKLTLKFHPSANCAELNAIERRLISRDQPDDPTPPSTPESPTDPDIPAPSEPGGNCTPAAPAGGARNDATGHGASSTAVVHNQGSWFYLDNLHGNGSLQNWRNRLWEGVYGTGPASVAAAARNGYFDREEYRNALNMMVAAGAITAAEQTAALSAARSGNIKPRDAVVLLIGATRHGATFGGGSDNLNWEEDFLWSNYINYATNTLHLSAEFAHGTMNNFKETVSAVMKGGDALTIEPQEWGLIDPDVWLCEWDPVLKNPGWW